MNGSKSPVIGRYGVFVRLESLISEQDLEHTCIFTWKSTSKGFFCVC